MKRIGIGLTIALLSTGLLAKKAKIKNMSQPELSKRVYESFQENNDTVDSDNKTNVFAIRDGKTVYIANFEKGTLVKVPKKYNEITQVDLNGEGNILYAYTTTDEGIEPEKAYNVETNKFDKQPSWPENSQGVIPNPCKMRNIPTIFRGDVFDDISETINNSSVPNTKYISSLLGKWGIYKTAMLLEAYENNSIFIKNEGQGKYKITGDIEGEFIRTGENDYSIQTISTYGMWGNDNPSKKTLDNMLTEMDKLSEDHIITGKELQAFDKNLYEKMFN